MKRRCVVNFADSRGHYVRWQDRLLLSLRPYVEVLAWRDDYPPGSPTHQRTPYGFKPYAFAWAQAMGYETVLWCDSPVWARRDPAPVFDLIERQGHAFFRNGFTCGEWCHDRALEAQRFTRDEAMAIPDFTGCCMGLDVTGGSGAAFLAAWKAAADDGVSFPGDWTNERGQCSADRRCRGHRHDQVIGSIIAHRMGMALTDPGELFSYWRDDLADTVCLVNGRND